MPHPLVLQLRFTRSEFQRALNGVTAEEALRRFEPMNSIGWTVGHLACQEQNYWLVRGQGKLLLPELNDFGFGKPASTPPLAAMWQAWQTVTEATNAWLDTLTSERLTEHFVYNEKQHPESIGSMMHRVVHHYWYHIGESQAVRQLLGHQNLPVFVGAQHDEAPYTPED